MRARRGRHEYSLINRRKNNLNNRPSTENSQSTGGKGAFSKRLIGIEGNVGRNLCKSTQSVIGGIMAIGENIEGGSNKKKKTGGCKEKTKDGKGEQLR